LLEKKNEKMVEENRRVSYRARFVSMFAVKVAETLAKMIEGRGLINIPQAILSGKRQC